MKRERIRDRGRYEMQDKTQSTIDAEEKTVEVIKNRQKNCNRQKNSKTRYLSKPLALSIEYADINAPLNPSHSQSLLQKH